MVRVSSPAKLRPWSELTAKMVMGVVPGLVNKVNDTEFDTILGPPANSQHTLDNKYPMCRLPFLIEPPNPHEIQVLLGLDCAFAPQQMTFVAGTSYWSPIAHPSFLKSSKRP